MERPMTRSEVFAKDRMPLSEVAKRVPQRVPTKVFRLRWRFDFVNRAPKIGPWDVSSMDPANKAWSQDKTGLVRVAIEAECRDTQKMHTIFECDGHAYAFMQWEAYARIPALVKRGELGTQKPIKPITYIAGISVFTNDTKTTIWVNGRKDVRQLTKEEKEFKFKEHSI